MDGQELLKEEGALKMGMVRIGLFISLMVFCFPSSTAAAPAGSLDLSFNSPNGYKRFNSAANNRDRGVEVAIQADGKIVVLGYSHNGANEDLLLVRYNADGSLDTSFGTGGFVLYDRGGNDRGLGLALQADGKIVAVGYTYLGGQRDVLVLRYHRNGTLDGAFGTGGSVTYSSSGSATDIGFGVAIQADGRIIVVGESSNGSNQDAIVLRYTTFGTLDHGFGSGGVFVYGGAGNNMDRAFATAIQQDGRIVVVGASVVNNKDDVLVFRLHSNGTPDGTFGSAGVATYSGAGDHFDYGNGVALQQDGRIVVLGSTLIGTAFDILLIRYNANGALDTTFGTGGVVIYGDSGGRNDYGYGLVIQRDGKIVITGYTQGDSDDVLVARFDTTGSLDTTFGTDGTVTWNGTAGGTDYGQGIALQSDGKLIIAGFSHNGANEDLLVMRLLGSTDNEAVIDIRCFVATAAYGSYLDPHVAALRTFRDEFLMKNGAGRELTQLYYLCSPPLASLIERHESLRVVARYLLTPAVLAVRHPHAAMLVMALGGFSVVVFALRWRKKYRKFSAQSGAVTYDDPAPFRDQNLSSDEGISIHRRLRRSFTPSGSRE
jgi:uncharacterized delta-60 repeat protein